MTAALVVLLVLAAWLIFSPTRGPLVRVQRACGLNGTSSTSGARQRAAGYIGFGVGGRRKETFVSLTVVVQQLAALLKGGRSPSRLWDELWQLYVQQGGANDDSGAPRLSPGSAAVLSAARGAALRGAPVAEAIRSACSPSRHGTNGREPRIWAELAA